MSCANSTQSADRGTQIHVVASHHQTAAAAAKARDCGAILLSQSIACIDRKQPHLIEVAPVQRRKHGIRRSQTVAIPHRQIEQRAAARVFLVAQKPTKKTESRNRPVIPARRYRGLQKYSDRTSSGCSIHRFTSTDLIQGAFRIEGSKHHTPCRLVRVTCTRSGAYLGTDVPYRCAPRPGPPGSAREPPRASHGATRVRHVLRSRMDRWLGACCR